MAHDAVTCPECGGAGVLTMRAALARWAELASLTDAEYIVCPPCGGTGLVYRGATDIWSFREWAERERRRLKGKDT